jgi:hypothetical protein
MPRGRRGDARGNGLRCSVAHLLARAELVGEVFQRFLLPERQDQLLAALQVAANRARPEDPQGWDALLSLLHPGLRDPTADVHPNTFIRIEVRFHRALRTFRADPSASSLRACLAIVLELQRAVEHQTSHRPCGRDTYIAGVVIVEALIGLLPPSHRWVLTRTVDALFFKLYGDGEEAGFGHVPLALWRALAKGQVVAPVTLRLLDPTGGAELPGEEGPWFVEDLEGLVTPYSRLSWEELLFPSRRPPGLESV